MPNVSRIALARQLHRFAFALSVWLLISSRFSHVFAASTTEHLQRRNDDDDAADDAAANREAVDDDDDFELKDDDNTLADGHDEDEQRARDSASEHELPKSALPTRLKIVGDLATPAPESGVRLGFVPKQTYVQVRRYDEQLHLPRSAAYADAETQEELLNAPRLREVVSQKKTQEVYEEQGYEDAAYDHGGYKKAGEKHENKYVSLPSKEDKTDNEYALSTDRSSSSERGSPSNFVPTRYNATNTDSSHTNAKTFVAGSGGSSRRQRPRAKSRTPTSRRASSRAEPATKAPSTSAHPPPRLARIYAIARANASTRFDEPKQMEQSEFHTTVRPLTTLDIEPITYRPIQPALLVSKLKLLRSMRPKSPIKIPLVGDDGYKFENPFELADVDKQRASTRTRHTGLHDKENAPYQRIPVYTIRDDGDQWPRVRAAKRPPTKKPAVANEFPYEIIEPEETQSRPATHGRKRVKVAFPYKIVDSSAYEATPEADANRQISSATKVAPQYAEVTFGEPDNSPWIPIVPKAASADIYAIHGYEEKRPKPAEIKVTESDDDGFSSTTELNVRFSPIKVYDLPKQTVATSYTIQHVHPNVVRRPSHDGLPYDLQHTAESKHPYSSGGAAFKPHRQSNRNATSAAARGPTTTMSNLRNDRVTTPVPTTTTATTTTTGEDVIETMSSNRYSIFQRFNQTTTPAIEVTTAATLAADELERLFLNAERDKLMFRHPHLSRDESRFVKSSPTSTEGRPAAVWSPARNVSTTVPTTAAPLKRDIVVSSVKNGSVTQLTKVAKRNDIAYQKPILVYPQDYMSSAKYVEKLTLAHFSFPENAVYNAVPLGYRDRMASLASHLKNETGRVKRDVDDDDDDEEKLLKISLGGTTTEIAVNLRKYPFYTAAPTDSLSKYSALRYASNPRRIPRKRAGKMSFYESRNNVRCVEPSPPENIVPKRVDGQWAYDPRPRMPRVSLGDKISCLKVKFFGADPLDNPFFKEDRVGFPEIQRPKKVDKLSHIEEVAEQQDFEMLPVKSSNLRERRSIREWIDSLAAAPSSNVNKRSLRKADEGAKQASKTLFVGGFLNRENATEKRPSSSPKPNDQRPIVSSSTAVDTAVDDAAENEQQTDEPPSGDNFDDYEAELSREIAKIKPKAVDYAAAKVDDNYRAKPATSSARFQLYRQPTWRVRPNVRIVSTPTTRTTAKSAQPLPRDVDSLLYVIHPKTGQGKWMKILKVEDVDDETPPEDSASLGNETPPLSAVLYRPEDDRKMPCKQTEDDSEKSPSSEYDVYHISGLLRQVAPLKANEMEINSLQTTNENLEDERDGDVAASLERVKKREHSVRRRFPQPHERLYYYVVDDERK